MNASILSGARFGPLLSDNGVTFRLWAPAARAVNLVLDRKNRDVEGQRVVRAQRPTGEGRQPAIALRSMGASKFPTRPRTSSRMTYMGRAKSSIIGMNGNARTGRDGPGMRRYSLNFTSARSRPKAHSAPRSRNSITWRATGYHGARADAARRIFPAAGTGAMTGCCRSRRIPATAGRRTSRHWSTPRMRAG